MLLPVKGASYFEAFYRAALDAERSITILKGFYEDSVPSSRNGIEVQLFDLAHAG